MPELGSTVYAAGDSQEAVQVSLRALADAAPAFERHESPLAFLASIVESSDDSIIGTGLDGTILSWNGGAERLWGYTAEEAIGRHITMLFPDDIRARYVDTLDSIQRAEHVDRRESVRVRKDGTHVPVSVIASPVRSHDGDLLGVSAVYRDITQQKRAERDLLDANQRLIEAKEAAERANRAKSDFLANMSHEIRTPMNGIMGMTELCLDTELTLEQREYLNTVKFSAESLLTIINDILDFSKIEADKLSLDPIDFSLREHIGQTMRTLAVRAQEKDLELAYDIPPELPEYLLGDPTRLRQIVVNLVGNAVKFTERGEVILRVAVDPETESSSHPGIALRFSIVDTGIGIPEEKLQAIFEPFTQADASTTRRFGGTGLGLSISTRLVSMMGGRLWVESRVGEGTAFHFTARFGIGRGVQTTYADASILENRRVLIVDDNTTNRHILERLLTFWRMRPTAVEGVDAALTALRDARAAGLPYALMVLDCHMPGKDGFALAEAMRADPGLAEPVTVMLTSGGQRGDAARCRELGIAAFLTKPALQSELLETLLRVLGSHAPAADPVPVVTRHALREGRVPLRILLAEDNLVNQRLAIRLLEKQGHSVAVAGDGRSALALWERQPFDLVLMDVQMPVMDGTEALTEIRARESGSGRRIPVIALTAHAMQGDRQKFLDLGMDGYLSKPIHAGELFAEVERVLPEAAPYNRVDPAVPDILA